MALHVPKAPGFQSMLKEGARVIKNILLIRYLKLTKIQKQQIFFSFILV